MGANQLDELRSDLRPGGPANPQQEIRQCQGRAGTEDDEQPAEISQAEAKPVYRPCAAVPDSE